VGLDNDSRFFNLIELEGHWVEFWRQVVHRERQLFYVGFILLNEAFGVEHPEDLWRLQLLRLVSKATLSPAPGGQPGPATSQHEAVLWFRKTFALTHLTTNFRGE
jgi:hypothetical protein